MADKDSVYIALYQLNLTQLAIAAALEDLTAIIEQVACLEPEISEFLRRHLSTVERNSDCSCEAIYSLISSRQADEQSQSPTALISNSLSYPHQN